MNKLFAKIKSFTDLEFISKSDEKPKYFNHVLIAIIIFFILLQTVGGVAFGMHVFIIIICIVGLTIKDGFRFVKDFWFPITLMYIYEVTRANAFEFSQRIGSKLLVEEIIEVERSIFSFMGGLPNEVLQEWLSPNILEPQLYDFILFAFYAFFFWAWGALALLLWRYKREYTQPYLYGLAAFSLVSVIIFAIVPTAPPWYAAQEGIIEPIERVLWQFEYVPGLELKSVNEIGQNDFAAIPSLHTGWVFYAALWTVAAFGKKYWFAFIAPAGIAFATWYGAEHYIIDSIIGAAMGLFFFYASFKMHKRYLNKKDRLQN